MASKDEKTVSKEDEAPSKCQKAMIPVQIWLDNHSRLILTVLFLISNVILIAFSSAVIALLNNNRKCDIEVILVGHDDADNFTKSDKPYTNINDVTFDYHRIYGALVPFNNVPDGQKTFWAILNAVFICILATSVITVVTLMFFRIVQSSANSSSQNKFNQKVVHTVEKNPPVFHKVSRIAAFIGAVLQILLFCCMTAVLMAAILQANFEDEVEDIAAQSINATLNGIMPTLQEDEFEAIHQEEKSMCWISVYVWIDLDPVVRFGVVLLAVSTFELMSIFTCAALMKRPSRDTDEYEPLTTSAPEENQHDNAGLETDDYDSTRPKPKNKEMEMKDKNSSNA